MNPYHINKVIIAKSQTYLFTVDMGVTLNRVDIYVCNIILHATKYMHTFMPLVHMLQYVQGVFGQLLYLVTIVLLGNTL